MWLLWTWRSQARRTLTLSLFGAWPDTCVTGCRCRVNHTFTLKYSNVSPRAYISVLWYGRKRKRSGCVVHWSTIYVHTTDTKRLLVHCVHNWEWWNAQTINNQAYRQTRKTKTTGSIVVSDRRQYIRRRNVFQMLASVTAFLPGRFLCRPHCC